VLTETMAIAAWLEARDSERRISFAPLSAEADRMRQLMGFVNTGFTGAFSPLWAAMEMAKPNPQMQASLREFGAARVIERHDKLEAMIGDHPFLMGEHPTLADGLLVGVARWLDFHQVADPSRWPRLAAIRRRIEADPAVIYAMALESGDIGSGSGACIGHILVSAIFRWRMSSSGSAAEWRSIAAGGRRTKVRRQRDDGVNEPRSDQGTGIQQPN
jgi:glutathione S-transferase